MDCPEELLSRRFAQQNPQLWEQKADVSVGFLHLRSFSTPFRVAAFQAFPKHSLQPTSDGLHIQKAFVDKLLSEWLSRFVCICNGFL